MPYNNVERKYTVERLLCIDNTKAGKAVEYGYLNGFLYLAPSNLSGKNLCSHASAGCIALCLGWFSGQAGMVSDDSTLNKVRDARIAKAQAFMHDRQRFLGDLITAIDRLVRKAARRKMEACIRLNGSSDIAFEGIRYQGKTIFEHFPDVVFVDYTKNYTRFRRALPRNYFLTLSRHESNEAQCIEALQNGINVAVVFEGKKPAAWHGFQVIDGDLHDLRHLDPHGSQGVVIGLRPKGTKAKHDTSGFVVRNAACVSVQTLT